MAQKKYGRLAGAIATVRVILSRAANEGTGMRDKLFIDGKWEKPRRGGMLDVIDPATEEVIHRAPAATYDDIDTRRQSCPHRLRQRPMAEAYGQRSAPSISARSPTRSRKDAMSLAPGSKSPTTASRCRKHCGTSTMPPAASAIMPDLPRNSTHNPEETIAARRHRVSRRACRARTARRRRRDHTVELSVADGLLEGGAGACRRLHHGAETVGADAADGA